MIIRNAEMKDLQDILAIYEHARCFMKKTNNETQWGNQWPPINLVIEDIEKQKNYVCINEKDEIIGVFFFDIMEDPTYKIIDGKWLNAYPYGVVHRIAVKNNRKGIGEFCLNWAFLKCKNIRIDTHNNNIPMKKLLKKLNYKYCGIIKTHNGSPRNAYQLYGGN